METVSITATGPVNTQVSRFYLSALSLIVARDISLPGGTIQYRSLLVNGSTKQYPIKFKVTSSNPDVLPVASEITVPAGSTTAEYELKPVTVTKKTRVKLTFRYGVYSAFTNVVVTPQP